MKAPSHPRHLVLWFPTLAPKSGARTGHPGLWKGTMSYFVEGMNYVLRAGGRWWRIATGATAAVLHALLLQSGEFGLLVVIQES